jgi:hypothetical protein
VALKPGRNETKGETFVRRCRRRCSTCEAMYEAPAELEGARC